MEIGAADRGEVHLHNDFGGGVEGRGGDIVHPDPSGSVEHHRLHVASRGEIEDGGAGECSSTAHRSLIVRSVHDVHEGTAAMSEVITMYSTTWCGYCRRLKRQMEDAGIAFQVVDLDENDGFDDRIIAKTGGYRTVPTLEIGGELYVNPTLREVQEALGAFAG